MREIKFRGKRKDNGEWIYGFLVKLSDNSGTHSYILEASENETGYGIDIDGYNDNYVDFFIEVIKESVGQYTGLKNINGQEFYEGDVVKSICSGNIIIHELKFSPIDGYNWEHLDKETIEVIGNIYENPELLWDKK